MEYIVIIGEIIVKILEKISLKNICRIFKRGSKEKKIEKKIKSGVFIEVNIGKLVDNACAIAIPSAQCFDTNYVQGIIGSNTAMASVIKSEFEMNYEKLDNLIEDFINQEELEGEQYAEKKIGKKTKYPFGTTLKIAYNRRNIYITSMAEISPDSVASVTFESMMLGLNGLWEFLKEKGHEKAIALPIWGGGNGRTQMEKIYLIQMIILSFFWKSKDVIRIADKLIISINNEEEDALSMMKELKKFLKLLS